MAQIYMAAGPNWQPKNIPYVRIFNNNQYLVITVIAVILFYSSCLSMFKYVDSGKKEFKMSVNLNF